MTVEPRRRSARVAAAAATIGKNKQLDEPVESQRPAKKARIVKPSTSATETSTNDHNTEEEATPNKKVSKVKNKRLELGDELPEGLVLRDQDDNELDLKQITKDCKIVVIFAYPRASTPGCTKQACGFRDLYPKFMDLSSKVTIFGLSADSVKAQKTFQAKQNLPYRLISDPKHKLIGPLGATKEVSKVTRSHWIFKDGKLWIKELKISPIASFEGALESVVAELEQGSEEAEGTTEETHEEKTDESVPEEAAPETAIEDTSSNN
ncbi:thioredoxin-like protein [Nadsonia fulvescens var. elongata DSM 6958]|uniref:thioredoxin-dependent peroxiredoxin n=1 Tax=Nadsonia fulvescens var. elongata DSM 6958 TaxID=857566 RepID=A0A1E3PRH7_9ASCO|nr:thioredoxin-like protein [Nadsonia fulvescens var. elongata DSM 6958]